MRYRSDSSKDELIVTFLWFFVMLLQVVFLGLHFGFGVMSFGLTLLPLIIGASVFALIMFVGIAALVVSK